MDQELVKHSRKIFSISRKSNQSFIKKAKEIVIEIFIIVFAITFSVSLIDCSFAMFFTLITGLIFNMVLFDFEGVDLIYCILIIGLAETIDSENNCRFS